MASRRKRSHFEVKHTKRNIKMSLKHVFNSTHKRNANKNYTKIPLLICHIKRMTTHSVGEAVAETGTLMH